MDSPSEAPTFDPICRLLDRTRKAGYLALSGTLCALAALVPIALFWGFSVDDAWIVTRVIEVARTTHTFSLHPGEPPVDVVTPLGFAQFIALLSFALQADPPLVARGLGAASWVLSFYVAGRAVAQDKREPFRIAAVALSALVSVTGAAWSGAGLETPYIALLLTLGFVLTENSRSLGPLLLGSAAALRPDLIPLALAAGQLDQMRLRRRAWTLGLTLIPIVLLMAVRFRIFGDFLPLAFRAKPPDFGSGVRYALGSLLLSGPFFWALGARGPLARRLWILILVHGVSLVFAGGDWMPLYRLSCPLLPWVCVLGARAAKGRWSIASLVLMLAGPLLLTIYYRTDSVAVVETRKELIEKARPLVASAERVAAVDIGWLSHATPGKVVDLSGVANPRVARLPGGHTSHLVPSAYLDDAGVDTWVVRVWDAEGEGGAEGERDKLPVPSRAVYAVDGRLLRDAEELGFRAVGSVPIPRTGSSYVILQRELTGGAINGAIRP
jgi:arabinofuranosyltransferase